MCFQNLDIVYVPKVSTTKLGAKKSNHQNQREQPTDYEFRVWTPHWVLRIVKEFFSKIECGKEPLILHLPFPHSL